MKLSNTVSYALQAVVRMADTFGGTPVPSSELASAGRMPDRFLLQILRTLVAREILLSTRGVFGGYTLARPPEQITILEIVEAVDGPITWALPLAKAFPKPARNKLEAMSGQIREASRAKLASVTVADLQARR